MRLKRDPREKNILVRYLYEDADGNPRLRVSSYRTEENEIKTFVEHWEGCWLKGTGGVRSLLQNLPGVLNSQTVIICTSEQTAETLNDEIRKKRLKGVIATNNFGNIQNRKWGLNNKALAGKKVILFAESDLFEDAIEQDARYFLWLLEQLPPEVRESTRVVLLSSVKIPGTRKKVFHKLTDHLRKADGFFENGGTVSDIINSAETQAGLFSGEPIWERLTQQAADPEARSDEYDSTDAMIIKERLSRRYEFRFNVVLQTPEVFVKKEQKWKELTERIENTILWEYRSEYHKPTLNPQSLSIFLNSEYTPEYHPFKKFFSELKPYDPQTEPDYIKHLAETVVVEEPAAIWYKYLRMWLVSVAATATWSAAGQLCLIFTGRQGDGKSKWFGRLVPENLRDYHSTTKIDFGDKDSFQFLTSRFLITLEEFDQYFSKKEAGAIKDFISREDATFRPPYARRIGTFARSASFSATTNETDFLSDLTGNRRFLVFSIKKINYSHDVPVDRVFAQAWHLYSTGDRFWLEGSEIQEVNAKNEQFRSVNIEEELVLKHFSPGDKDRTGTRFLTPSELTIKLMEIYPKVSLNVRLIGRILRKYNFPEVKQRTDSGPRRGFLIMKRETDADEFILHDGEDGNAA